MTNCPHCGSDSLHRTVLDGAWCFCGYDNAVDSHPRDWPRSLTPASLSVGSQKCDLRAEEHLRHDLGKVGEQLDRPVMISELESGQVGRRTADDWSEWRNAAVRLATLLRLEGRYAEALQYLIDLMATDVWAIGDDGEVPDWHSFTRTSMLALIDCARRTHATPGDFRATVDARLLNHPWVRTRAFRSNVADGLVRIAFG